MSEYMCTMDIQQLNLFFLSYDEKVLRLKCECLCKYHDDTIQTTYMPVMRAMKATFSVFAVTRDGSEIFLQRSETSIFQHCR